MDRMEMGREGDGLSCNGVAGGSYDAVVVGSGYGGSVAACRMSMAGITVCLIERGRKWEAGDFPTNGIQFMSALRMDSTNWGFSYGPKDGLFQVYEQDDSFAVVACGLGGGSLVNAGVMTSTPVRARRDPKWPKEWQKDWESCEESASAMLRPQNLPTEFANAKVMRQIANEEIEDCKPSPFRVSINFGTEEAPNSPKGSQQMGKCLACGNCLSGCPYDAKNSTDKNYVASAIQNGCVVKTECKALYVVKTPDEDCEELGRIRQTQRRRWRVYFDSLEYISADFVVLSAGVLGTAEILFQSGRRGLSLSERLGFGFSCNGNNTAYICGSSAPLNAYGLNKKKFSEVPFNDRPGPAISSSYTSSLGFTIQSGVIPTSYPKLVFKGIASYGWPIGYWFLDGLLHRLKHLIGLKGTAGISLNAMGFDSNNGRITLNEDTEKISFIPSDDPLLPRKFEVFQKISKRLGGILFISRYRSTSVHLLGGCNVASDPSNGVCNPNGQVFYPSGSSTMVHEGLYVCDASLIPCSVGINPCLTIATVAEHVSRHLVQDVLMHKSLILQTRAASMELKAQKEQEDMLFVDNPTDLKPRSNSGRMPKIVPRSSDEVSPATMARETATIRETMRGHLAGMPCTAYLVMKMDSVDLKDSEAENSAMGDAHPLLRGRVGGYIVFQAINKNKLHIIDGRVNMCEVDSRTPYTQYMQYHLLLVSPSGSRYVLQGKKIMNPYLLFSGVWRESTTLHVTFKTAPPNYSSRLKRSPDLMEQMVDLKGELHLSAIELLKSLITLKGSQRGKFLRLLSKSLLRTYILQTPRQTQQSFDPSNMIQRPYPPSILHELKSEDGCIISCRQWGSSHNGLRFEGDRQPYPVLLLNGYVMESYWLPTEQNDLIRTLLEEGYDTWLLQSRLHPSHPSNDFSIEDIGKFDIPTVMAKICEMYRPNVKVHVIAHCVGGLAIHMALLGGHLSANQIATLSCTNSSMFFKLTTSSLLKMRLPLIPISMAILGKNRIITMLENTGDSFRHRLLKSIARRIPRYERCSYGECEIVSGIFGNAFWHENISQSLHHWLNKQSMPRLPMSAFPHLRKICTSGFIVDSNGKNDYLIHPERMAVPTLYISGGRTLLATPETSYLANKYMRMHQPGFHHKRVVVDGFGHSDLLIGEESHKRVFPHFLSHMKLAERDGNRATSMEEVKRSREGYVSWDDEPYDAQGRLGAWVSWFFLLMFLFLSFYLALTCK